MTNHIYVDRPAPYCILHATDPRRAFEREANVDRTFEQNRPIRDDYELTDQLGYLETIGDFQ